MGRKIDLDLEDIVKKLDLETEVLTFTDDKKMCWIDDFKTRKMKRAYSKTGKGFWREINLPDLISRLVERLKDKVDVAKVLEEALYMHSVETLLEAEDRLKKPDAKITDKPRCYSLMIGGKRGSPLEINLVS